jgi:hypothetical protein
MEYYDDEIKESVSKLPSDDKLRLLESLFNAMTNSMRAFYLQAGHSDREIQMLINTEIKGVKELIASRLILVDERDSVIDEKLSETTEPTRLPADDQLVNDAMIDLGLIFEAFRVKPE